MSNSKAILDLIKEQLTGFGPVSIRGMFGGHGVFHDGLMFALVADDTLYFKSDEETDPHFEAHGLDRFRYEGKGRVMEMSYRRAPEDVLDDPDSMSEWARLGLAAAMRANKAKPAKKPKVRKPRTNVSKTRKTSRSKTSPRKP
ncbi:MAG: TfoX/Sxy family protein [Filomicrobium sp.]